MWNHSFYFFVIATSKKLFGQKVGVSAWRAPPGSESGRLTKTSRPQPLSFEKALFIIIHYYIHYIHHYTHIAYYFCNSDDIQNFGQQPQTKHGRLQLFQIFK